MRGMSDEEVGTVIATNLTSCAFVCCRGRSQRLMRKRITEGSIKHGQHLGSDR